MLEGVRLSSAFSVADSDRAVDGANGEPALYEREDQGRPQRSFKKWRHLLHSSDVLGPVLLGSPCMSY